MSITVPESVDLVQDLTDREFDQLPSQPLANAAHQSPFGTSWRYLASVAVWLLYVPHFAILWLLGPRYGLLWARCAANVHWLLAFVDAQRSTRRSLEQVYPLLRTSLSISAILRLNLELKHDCFARVRVYNLHGANSRMNDIQWRVNPSCASAVQNMQGRDRGLIIVGFHFGYFQLLATALSQVVPGCNPVQLRHRIAQCAEQTMSPIAQMVMRRAIEADRRSGAPIFYIDAGTSLLQLVRTLRTTGCVAVAADGMLADEFVEVPFFDGSIRVPSGWARLALATKSDVLFVYDTHVDRNRRDGWFFQHADSAENSLAAVHRAVAEAVRVLEMAIRREPWGWHPWQRLRWERAADGSPRYYLRQFGAGAEGMPGRNTLKAAGDQSASRRGVAQPSSAMRSGHSHNSK